MQLQLSKKQIKFFLIFFLNIMKTKMTLIAYVSRKTCLDKCLKNPVSEYPSTVNIIKVAKLCWNLHDSTFIIFFHSSERNWIAKLLILISEILGLFFRNYGLRKTWLDKGVKKLRFRTHFDSQHAKLCQTPLKIMPQHFCQIFPSPQEKWSCKMSLLVISEILGLSVSTLTANDNYSFRISQNLQQPIKMQLSKKHNYFLLNILLNF